jgi:uncharacterized membrane protein
MITEVFYSLAFPIVVLFFGLMIMERVLWAFVLAIRFIRRAAGQPE